ncbi:MAG: GNAT family N-acetyltransferase [Candidatus Dormibacteria bacterium]
MTYSVRAVTEDEWRVLRSVRLQALANAPTAFGSTLAEANTLTEDRWRDRARGSSRSRQFLAWLDEEAVGIAGLFDEGDGSAQVVSVWVRPEHRGRGVARALTTAAMDFAAAAGIVRLTLWVTDGNAAARRLYDSMGFRPTGNRQPLPSQPTLDEHEMAVHVAPAVPATDALG